MSEGKEDGVVGILRPTDYAGVVLQKAVHRDKPGQAATLMVDAEGQRKCGHVLPGSVFLHRCKDILQDCFTIVTLPK